MPTIVLVIGMMVLTVGDLTVRTIEILLEEDL